MRQRVLDYLKQNDRCGIDPGDDGLHFGMVLKLFKDDPDWIVQRNTASLLFINRHLENERQDKVHRQRQRILDTPGLNLGYITLVKIRSAKARMACVQRWTLRVLRSVLTRDVISLIFNRYLHYEYWLDWRMLYVLSKENARRVLEETYPRHTTYYKDYSIRFEGPDLNFSFQVEDPTCTEENFRNYILGKPMDSKKVHERVDDLFRELYGDINYLNAWYEEMDFEHMKNSSGQTFREYVNECNVESKRLNLLEALDQFEARKRFLE